MIVQGEHRVAARLGSVSEVRRSFTAGLAALGSSAVFALAPAGASTARVSHAHRAGASLEYGCPILPAEDPLNQEIAERAGDPNSANYIASIGLSAHLHPDFGTDPSYGIPYTVVGPEQPKVPIKFTKYRSESNPGPYPVPANAPIEGGGKNGHGDKHVLVVQEGSCMLYELYKAHRKGAGWTAPPARSSTCAATRCARRLDLRGRRRPADLPAARRYPEVAPGQIDHALRVTVPETQDGYIHPATHFASSSSRPEPAADGPAPAPEGQLQPRRLHGESLVILEALKRYGLIVADNGSPWFITGAPNPAGTTKTSNRSSRSPAREFEAVESGPILHG
jgi:hypothetical protein